MIIIAIGLLRLFYWTVLVFSVHQNLHSDGWNYQSVLTKEKFSGIRMS